MNIILLRHGETIWNKEHRLQGCQDIPLADEGREQIRRTGRHLTQIMQASSMTQPTHTIQKIDLILTSPLIRAKESAEIIARELKPAPESILPAPLFMERNFGIAEGLTYREALALYPDNNYPGMEPMDQLCERAKAAICQCAEKYPDKTVLVVAHGAIIKAALVAASNGRITYFDETIWISNGSYCLLEQADTHWKISLHNADGPTYLPQYDGAAPLS